MTSQDRIRDHVLKKGTRHILNRLENLTEGISSTSEGDDEKDEPPGETVDLGISRRKNLLSGRALGGGKVKSVVSSAQLGIMRC